MGQEKSPKNAPTKKKERKKKKKKKIKEVFLSSKKSYPFV